MPDPVDRKAEPPPWGAALATLVFAVLFMGSVIAYVPYWLSGWKIQAPVLGPFSRGLGVALLILAAPALLDFLVRFVREGRGTPAPFAPPQRLVIGGVFQHVRNPGYLAAVAMIVGQGLLLGSPEVLVYAAFVALAFHLFVVLYEEPTLRGKFGAEYEAYCRQVPRWMPRVTSGVHHTDRPSD